jgi:hypothetical protein
VTLGFLEKLTLTPADVGPEDALSLRAVGLSNEAIETAIYICAFFNIIDRLADALNIGVPAPEELANMAATMLTRGYQFSAIARMLQSE